MLSCCTHKSRDGFGRWGGWIVLSIFGMTLSGTLMLARGNDSAAVSAEGAATPAPVAAPSVAAQVPTRMAALARQQYWFGVAGEAARVSAARRARRRMM